MANIEKFDQMASGYATGVRVTLFEIFKAELIKLGVAGRVLDFGSGPGNLGISIANYCDSVCMLEPAPAMRDIIHQKIDFHRLENCYVTSANLEQGEELAGDFDYIVVAQVLLHIPEYQQLLAKLVSHLTDSGKLVIFDYLKNQQVKSDIVHNGFEINQLKAELTKLGLNNISHKLVYEDDNLLLGAHGELFMMIAEI